jgi:hypothetical protein
MESIREIAQKLQRPRQHDFEVGGMSSVGHRMENFSASDYGGVGLVIIKRLHRMVRHGFRPWLGYSVASFEDEDIHLRRGSEVATIHPDGSVWFVFKVPLARARADSDGNLYKESSAIFADDSENFDALFPANSSPPKRGRFVQRLYEFGF